MALEHEPPAVDGVEVRRIGTLDEHLAGLEIMLASATWSDAAAAADRAPAATRRSAMARVPRKQARRLCCSRPRPGRALSRRRIDTARGARTRLLSRTRPCALGRGDPARSTRPGRAGAIRVLCADLAQARIRRSCDRRHAAVAGGPAGLLAHACDNAGLYLKTRIVVLLQVQRS
jgi:hypothetical protein